DPGVTTVCTVVLKNQGGTDAGAFANDIRLSIDRTIDATDSLLATCAAAALPAGSTETITCPATIPATATQGVYYYVGVMADSPGVVTESDETNNHSFTPILVAAPPPTYGSAWYERDYDGRNLCPRGYSPVWGLFSWNANTPKDSHIDFSVQTAPTNAQLNNAQSAAMAVVARATAATPPGYGGGTYPTLTDTADTQTGSVIVNTVLERETLPTQDAWLRVQANLVGSRDRTVPPSLSAWGLQVGCVASQ
ncbi:MAG TPA: CARDB domain-containing protein, partial [Polyangiaceae bacterium]